MKGKGILLLCTFMMLAVFLWGSVAHSEDVAALNTAIQARGGKWVAGETSVSRLTPAQQASLVGLTAEQCVMTSTPTASPPSSLSVPTHFDWRDNGGNYVTSIKNQGNCGSCWAFASTGALESATLITTGKPNTDLDLSEQMLISCGNAGSCSGGYIDDAANYIRDTGLPAESCFPYGGSGGCGPSCPTNKIQNWHWVYHSGTYASADVLKSQLVTYGPLVTTMAVYVDFFSYASGIYTYPGGGYLAGFHAVIIVGYDDPGQYFIAKNSWGTGWGEQGYFRIGYSELTSIVGFGGRACGTVAYETTHANPTLSVSKAGTGSGTVTSYPDGINCGSTCSASYANGTLVTLTATPDALMTFAGWSGACSGTGTCTVTMDTAKSVTATFNLAGYTLWVQKAGGATGTVTSYPSGINCGSTCSANYATGSQVTLTATPGPNATFAGWVEACSGTGTCTVTMNATKSVAAYFNVAGYALSVAKSGTGTGTVTSSPSGINCGTTCSANYATNSQVTLTATPDPNVTFTGWSGACSGTGTCTVTMNAGTSVTATFTGVYPSNNYTLTVVKAGAAPGTVTSSPAGIGCGWTCAVNFAAGTQVTLTATPYVNVTFTGWSGACSGTGTCTVTMDAAKSATATFSVSPNSAYYCYSPSYANYSYQTWLCNAMYHPTICYTINWQLTTCPQ
ncbi:MAG TPA: C1 family peptidase [Syntrophorhabdales bacterium]|nr:C1 family peptidase [Syntrophorhabdales bacterium]